MCVCVCVCVSVCVCVWRARDCVCARLLRIVSATDKTDIYKYYYYFSRIGQLIFHSTVSVGMRGLDRIAGKNDDHHVGYSYSFVTRNPKTTIAMADLHRDTTASVV